MRLAIFFALIALVGGCARSEHSAMNAFDAFRQGCYSNSFLIELKDTTDGDRTFFARCKVIK